MKREKGDRLLFVNVRKMVAVPIFIGLTGGFVQAQEKMELGEVVVTATRLERPYSRVAQSVDVIKGEDIERSVGATVSEVLKRRAGIDITSYGDRGQGKNIKIRGSETSQVLILINGRRINNGRNNKFDFSNIPIHQIERIEILKEAASALYGADAMAGVINIITREPIDKSDTRLGFIAGEMGTFVENFSYSNKFKNLGVVITAGKEDTNGFRHNTFLDQEDVSIRLDYDFPETGRISFDILHVNGERGSPGSVQEDENWRIAREYSDWQRDRQTRAGLGLDFGNWQNINLKVDVYNNYDKMEYWDNWDSSISASDMSVHDDWERGIQSHIAFPFGDWQILSAGVDFLRQQSSSTSLGDNHLTRSSVFIQDEIDLFDFLIVTCGGRYDRHSLYANKFNPRFSAAFLLPWETKLRASWGKAYRAPTLNDLYWPASSSSAGNPDLKAESGKSYEFGLEQNWGEDGFLGFTYFERKVDDLIEWTKGDDNKWRPGNVSKARIEGIEIDLRDKLLDRIDIMTNYTYLNPENRETRTKLPDKARHRLNLGFIFHLLPGLSLDLNGRYAVNYVDSDNKNKPWEDYFVTELKLTQKLDIKGVEAEIYFGIENLRNTRYMSIENYPAPERAFYGGINLKI
jgi:outer membrane cobalamin receptor